MRIKEASPQDFETVYADMQKQFPSSETKTREAFTQLMKTPEYDFCVFEENDKIAGYFFAYIARDTNIVLLDHFAIMHEFQDKGFGSQALDLIQTRYVQNRGIMLEVEKPNPLEPNTLRRIKFYKRAGAYKLDIFYLLPSNEGTLPMDLYFINCGGFEGKISKEEIEETVKEIFMRVHSSFANAREVWNILEKSFSRG